MDVVVEIVSVVLVVFALVVEVEVEVEATMEVVVLAKDWRNWSGLKSHLPPGKCTRAPEIPKASTTPTLSAGTSLSALVQVTRSPTCTATLCIWSGSKAHCPFRNFTTTVLSVMRTTVPILPVGTSPFALVQTTLSPGAKSVARTVLPALLESSTNSVVVVVTEVDDARRKLRGSKSHFPPGNCTTSPSPAKRFTVPTLPAGTSASTLVQVTRSPTTKFILTS
mmetsp:Transcript_39814/g.84975  ORF Transcript_39814/g.84975 Transcript_39814/m.84975 type:complete len:223 (+) Transcript_39814:832-1500(+)